MSKSNKELWIFRLISSSDMFINKPLKIALYLLNGRNKDGLVVTTIRKISDDLNISERTVISTLNVLKDLGFVSMIQKGVYKIEFGSGVVDISKLNDLNEKKKELERLKILYSSVSGKTKKNIRKKIRRLEKEIELFNKEQ